ncbi:MAG: hypothetical protein HZA54_16535 [Planctomycetes bacterium]|nr:hypothetical protein [Planctomycetota bacterium]
MSEDEVARILRLVGGDHLRAYEMIERQMGVLVLRTQVLLSLSGIVITVTGFSGRLIAETSALARLSITSGIFLVLVAAALAIGGVLRLTWMTQEIGPEPRVTLERGIALRDGKSRMLSLALLFFVAGLACYCFAIAQLLWATHPK